jgi:hypothetical protein
LIELYRFGALATCLLGTQQFIAELDQLLFDTNTVAVFHCQRKMNLGMRG